MLGLTHIVGERLVRTTFVVAVVARGHQQADASDLIGDASPPAPTTSQAARYYYSHAPCPLPASRTPPDIMPFNAMPPSIIR